MFAKYHIVNLNNEVGIEHEAQEFIIHDYFSIEILVIHSLAEQLKIAVPKIGYAFINDQLRLVQKINPEHELWEDTLRFRFNPKMLINVKEILLYTMLLNMVKKNVPQDQFSINWGLKNEIIFPIISLNNQPPFKISNQLSHFLKPITNQQREDIKQRFWILLNNSYLDKLKTFILFWQQKQNINYQLPAWMDSMFELEKNSFDKAKIESIITL